MSATYGALIHSEYPNAENPRPTTFPGMIWGTNYTRLVSQTVFTLFYAGRTYAPKCIIDGINIQDWLLSHFIGACVALAKGIAKVPGLYDECVIGWDSMNEPGEGFIGHPNLAVLNPELKLRKGPMPSPLEGLKLGMGEAVEVDDYYFGALGPTRGKKVKLDPKGKKLWLSSRADEERGSGKWGWKRDPGWDVEQCGESLLFVDHWKPDPRSPRSLGSTRDLGPKHWYPPQARLLCHPTLIRFSRRFRGRFLARAFRKVCHSHPRPPSRGHLVHPTASVPQTA